MVPGSAAVINALVVNLFGLTLCGLLGVTAWSWWRHPTLRRSLRGVLAFELLLVGLCLPAVAHLALGSLEWQYPPRRSWPAEAQAIVILAGSLQPADDVRLRDELGLSTFGRCHHGVEVFRATGIRPIVVTGGSPFGDARISSAAAVMRDELVERGVPAEAIVVEDRSQSTRENAVESARLLRDRGLSRIILVTDATHMRRALQAFRAQGLTVTPSACNHRATGFRFNPVTQVLPNPASAKLVIEAVHEWIGRLWYGLKGWAG